MLGWLHHTHPKNPPREVTDLDNSANAGAARSVALVGLSFAGARTTPPSAAGREAAVYRVGVAAVDITPPYPVRLSGFGFRREESAGVTQRIWAKALTIDDGHGPVVLIAVDNLGIPASMVTAVARKLADAGVRLERLAITATHTHTVPMLTGVAPTLFGTPIPPAHQRHIDRYTRELTEHLCRLRGKRSKHRRLLDFPGASAASVFRETGHVRRTRGS